MTDPSPRRRALEPYYRLADHLIAAVWIIASVLPLAIWITYLVLTWIR
jgi:hypothetical protein